MIARNRELLFFGVARNLEYLHPIAECRGNRIEDVRGRDEQHLGQIERHVKVMVAEGNVLLRIEHFEQRRGRIAAEVVSELVDFVEDEDRVLRFGAAKALYHLSG